MENISMCGRQLFLFCATLFLLVGCEKEEPIFMSDPRTYPVDSAFERLLIAHKIDFQPDGLLRHSDIMKIDSLNLTRFGEVTSLRGIEHFANLRALIIYDIQIDSLILSKNLKLEYLWCKTVGPEDTGRSLKYLDVSGCSALRYLNCESNLLESIDISQNARLGELHCGDNPNLMGLDLTHNSELEVINCGWAAKISNLDVSKNPKLRSVSFPATKITQLDMSMLPALTILDCRFTKFRKINLKNSRVLRELYITQSAIYDINFSDYPNLEALTFGENLNSFDLTPLKKLRIMDCAGIREPKINLSENLNLEHLSIRHSDFENIDLSRNTKLKILSLLEVNYIKSIDLRHNIELTSAYSIGNERLQTICVNKLPDADNFDWAKDSWTNYVVCK